MSMKPDLTNMLIPYDGSGNVSMWMKKAKLVAKAKKIKDLADFVPLYLEGEAFCVYDEMADADKENAEKIETTLRAAFEMDRYTAYEAFQMRRWCPGESADFFLADLRRLAKLAQIEDEEAVRGAFVTGLPTDVSQRFRGSARSATCKLSGLCEQARVLLQQRMQIKETAAAASSDTRVFRTPTPAAGEAQRDKPPGGRRCFLCDGGHFARACPRRADRRSVTCWRCGEQGHVIRSCPNQGNGKGDGPSVA